MDIFAQASLLKLRFEGLGKGSLSTEDLWSLKPEVLNGAAMELDNQIAKYGQQGYLQVASDADTSIILQRDILVYILKYKLQMADNAKANASKTAQRKELELLIATKKREAMASKSVEELMAELNAL